MRFTTYLRLTVMLAAAVFPVLAMALPTTIYASQSKLATGRWVKIKVKERGIQQITDDRLREMGFSDPSKVAVFGYGGALHGDDAFSVNKPDDLPAQTFMRHNGRLLFYGEPGRRVDMQNPRLPKLIQNYESDCGYYFLTDSHKGETPSQIPFRESASGEVTTYLASDVVREETQNRLGGGAIFYGPDLAPDFTRSYTFDISSRAKGSAVTVSGYIALGGDTPAVEIEAAGEKKTYRAYGEIAGVSVKRFEITVGDSRLPSDGQLKVTFTPGNNKPDFAAVDYISAAYTSPMTMDSRSELIMACSVKADQHYRLKGAGESTVVWQIRTADKVRPFATKTDGATGDLLFSPFQSYSSTGYYDYVIAFDPDADHHEVEFAGRVGNQNLHSRSVPDYMIITTDLCRSQAERLASLHKAHSGLDVLVVTADEVYNEFSSGTPVADAYRRVAKMFYDRNSRKFKYLLLFGGGSYDNRLKAHAGLTGGNSEMLLTYATRDYDSQLEDAFCYTADSYFAMLDDSATGMTMKSQTLAPSIAVGRVPAMNQGDARAYVDKVEQYLKTPFDPAVTTRAVVMSDDGDADSHMIQAEELSRSIVTLSPLTTVTRAYDAIYPWTDGSAAEARRHITRTLKAGAWYWCYVGHGRPDSFTGEDLWHRRYVTSTDYDFAPFTFLSTCESFGFDRLNNAIGEMMLFKQGGGSIAVIGASRTVYKEHNQVLNLAFANALFRTSDPTVTLGDAWRRALAEIFKSSSTDLKVNTLAYNLGGDPALPLRRVTSRVSVTSINGSSDKRLACEAQNRIVGQITDGSGIVVRQFDGQIKVTVFESPDSVDNLYQPSNGKKVPEKERIMRRVELDETILAETTADISGGNFDFTMVVPPSVRPFNKGRVVMTAMSEQGGAAATVFEALIDEARSGELVGDNEPPVIDRLYIDTPSFADGDVVGSDFVLHADVSADVSGIAVRSSSIGMAPRLVLDNSRSIGDVSGAINLSPDGSAVVAMPVSGIEDGLHTLTLTVSDNIGNKTSRSVDFTVVTKGVEAMLGVEESPARSSATITLQHNFAGDPAGRIVIENPDGTAVFTRDNVSFPFQWNLTGSDGVKVSDGTYTVRAYLRHERRFAVAEPVRVTVLKPLNNDF